MSLQESTHRIEPTSLAHPTVAISDLIAELTAGTTTLGKSLHPKTASNLADLVRLMNTYYSNLIEGHHTRPRDIERALKGDLDANPHRRNLQLEATAHIRVQAEIDTKFRDGVLPDPASVTYLRSLHRDFYKDLPAELLTIEGAGREFKMKPGEWRTAPEHDVEVGRHLPPSSDRVVEFMKYFERCYQQDSLGGRSGKLIALAAAHHRFNFIHPFPDGNGRVSRLMSHAMAHTAGVGAHGLWSISRGLARGIDSRSEYKSMMDRADTPRQGDLDGRGNLSQAALIEFVEWFLKVCVDQVTYMSSLFELGTLSRRLRLYVERSETLKPEASRLLEAALTRGEIERGEIAIVAGLPERTARRVLGDLTAIGLLASDTPKGPVSLRFPTDTLEVLFPRLFPET